jgi:hypothetical protein
LALGCALVLAPRPSLAGPAATAEPSEGAPAEELGQDDHVEQVEQDEQVEQRTSRASRAATST